MHHVLNGSPLFGSPAAVLPADGIAAVDLKMEESLGVFFGQRFRKLAHFMNIVIFIQLIQFLDYQVIQGSVEKDAAELAVILDEFTEGMNAEKTGNAVAGAASQGVYAYIKHLASYDGNYKMVCIWSNEQAIREIYLSPLKSVSRSLMSMPLWHPGTTSAPHGPVSPAP